MYFNIYIQGASEKLSEQFQKTNEVENANQ